MLIAAELRVIFKTLMLRYSDEATAQSYWEELLKKYTGSSRHYHNLIHLKHMIDELEPVEDQVNDLDCLLFAIFYHDIIYKATRKDNEHQSALLFQKRISNTSFDRIETCMKQIEATKAHLRSEDKDTNILLDLDLAILGQPWESYETYTKQIRKEYKIYPDFMYKKGRAKAMEDILRSEQTIFKTEYFQERYEQKAQANIAAELKLLKK